MLRDLRSRRLLALAPLLLFAFGAYVSLRYSLGLWHADPDVSVPFNLWQGASRHGVAFLKTWTYSPDNWLFSLLPLDAALLTLSPNHPTIIVLSGWAIFLASAALTGALLAQMSGRLVGLWLAAALSFANYQALGAAGFLSYPITHNISMLWGLAALWLCAVGLRAPGRAVAGLALVAGCLCLLLNGLSDPWAAVAVTLPVALTGGAVGVLARRDPLGRRALWLCVGALLVFAATRSRGFGMLAFLPPSPLVFTNADGVAQNAGWAFRALAATFNVVPHANPDSVPPMVISGLAAMALIGTMSVVALQRLSTADLPTRFVIGVCMASLAAISGAFLVGEWPHGLMVGRFFPNGYFFAGLVVAWAATRTWGTWRPAARAAGVVYAVLFMAAGVLSFPSLWTGRTAPRGHEDILQIARFLDRQGLHYGYGPYWGAYALSMDWVTGGKTIVRPVTFRGGRVARRPFESSPYWYSLADEPPALRERFLVIAKDGDECPSVEECVAEAVAQFGPAARDIPYGDMRILVWTKPIGSLLL